MNALIKQFSLAAARSEAFSRLLSVLERFDRGCPYRLPVLTYHRVCHPDSPFGTGLLSATPDEFERQVEYLASRYRVLSMPEVVQAWRTGGTLPRRSLLITFDDAYRDFAEHAWPILKRHGLPVTLFVPTAYPDHPERPFWWDRLRGAVTGAEGHEEMDTPLGRLPLATPRQRMQAYRRLNTHAKTLPHAELLPLVDRICVELGYRAPVGAVLGWDALRQLAREGVTLGAHTRTHPLMNRVTPEEARAEAAGSLRDLQSQVGPVLPIFAYPAGGLSDAVVRILAEEGFRLAFTTLPGINDMRSAEPLRLRRINVGFQSPLPVIRARLLPAWRRPERSRPPHRDAVTAVNN